MIVNTKKETDASSSRETDFVIYKNTSDSLQEGFRRLINEAPKKMYGAQIELLILDESLAKNDLKNIMDFLARDPEVRSEFYVIVGKNDNILEITTPLVNINSKNIIQSLESNNTYLGSVNLVTFHDLIDNYLNDKIDLALPAIKMIGNNKIGDENNNLENTNTKTFNLLSNIAIFKDNKLVPFKNKTKALVIKAMDGQMLITVDDNIYELREVPKHKEISDYFMEKPKSKSEKKVYIPPMSHPWKHDSYIKYLNTLHITSRAFFNID